jgi:hypothetical protein
MKMSMRNHINPAVFGALLHATPSLAALPLEQQETARQSELAALAATTGAGKTRYGILAFWIVVAILVAARVAFLDPSKIWSNPPLLATKATAAWNASESASAERFVAR